MTDQGTVGVEAAGQELARYIHVNPNTDVTITPFPSQPTHYWIGSWGINDHTCGNIWHDAQGWHVSVNLPEYLGHGMLRPMEDTE